MVRLSPLLSCLTTLSLAAVISARHVPGSWQGQPAPWASTVQAPPPASTADTLPSASTAETAPPASTAETAPPASTAEANPPASTAETAPSSTPSTTTATTTSTTGQTYTGDITHYDVGLGSCGQTNTDADAVCALSVAMMANGANPNTNPKCGKTITLVNPTTGSQTKATVVDTCQACAFADVDLSPTLFQTVAPDGDGRVSGIQWSFDD